MNEKDMHMDCAQFDEILHDLDRPGTKGAALCEIALAHAESCNRCAELLNQGEWLDFNLLRLMEEMSNRQAPPRVESSLLEEFRRTRRASAWHSIPLQAAVLGAAAALLLTLGLLLHHHVSAPPATPASATQQIAARPMQPTVTTPAAEQTGLASVVAPPRTKGGLTAGNGASDADDSAEYATNFVQLPYADDSLDEEGGTIIRVDLPRSALASFGLPVVEVDGAERIQADLVVSADGTPQAIRLVSQTNPREEF